MYYLTVWNELKGTTQDITCPEFVRLSEGPRWAVKKVPWLKNQKFYRVLDLDTGLTSYMTTLEARVHCGMARNGFRLRMKNKKKRGKPIADRYIMHELP